MIKVIVLLISILLGTLAVITLSAFGTVSSATGVGLVLTVVLIIWACVIVCSITGEIKDQAEDFHKYKNQEAKRDALIKEHTKDKKANEEALTRYKGETKEALLDSYRQFEENLMEKVRDSKLIAMIIEKSGYADVLDRYHSHIIRLTGNIKECDNSINFANKDCEVSRLNYAKKMLVRQSNGIFGLHYFFPRHLIFREIDDK